MSAGACGLGPMSAGACVGHLVSAGIRGLKSTSTVCRRSATPECPPIVAERRHIVDVDFSPRIVLWPTQPARPDSDLSTHLGSNPLTQPNIDRTARPWTILRGAESDDPCSPRPPQLPLVHGRPRAARLRGDSRRLPQRRQRRRQVHPPGRHHLGTVGLLASRVRLGAATGARRPDRDGSRFRVQAGRRDLSRAPQVDRSQGTNRQRHQRARALDERRRVVSLDQRQHASRDRVQDRRPATDELHHLYQLRVHPPGSRRRLHHPYPRRAQAGARRDPGASRVRPSPGACPRACPPWREPPQGSH